MIELVLLTLILLGMLVGTICGILYRRAKIRQIRSRQTNIPAYQLEHHLSPVEFAIICEGTVTNQAVIAQLVALIMSGRLTVERSHTGTLILRRATHQTDAPSDDTAYIRHFIQSNQDQAIFSGGGYLKSAMSYEAIKSLKQKGWLNDDLDKQLRPVLSGPAITILGIAFLIGGGGVAMILLGITKSLLLENIAILMILIAIIILLIMIVRYTFIFNAQKSFHSNSRIVRAITPRFVQEYHTVYDVYTYLKVSGLDTMTPDYDTLDFKGLDALYPYAITVGLDPKIIRALQ